MNAICTSCGARIVWAKTEYGKAMPLDAQTTLLGNIALSRLGTAIVVGVGKGQPGEPMYTSHFATCPQAAQHRRRR